MSKDTPRTDEAQFYSLDGEGPAIWTVEADFARTIERELTAAKAEIARLNRRDGFDLQQINRVAADQTKNFLARAERAEAQLRERTQWQCACGGTDCAGMAENERLRAEVAAFKANNRYMRGHTAGYAEARDEYGEQLKPLFAKVRELEQDKARLAYVIANGPPECAFGEEWHYGDYNSANVYETPEAAIDAARAGKGAT